MGVLGWMTLGMNQRSSDQARDLVDAVTNDLGGVIQSRTAAVEQRLARVLEAMAAGCCCVAADCPQGPADLIQDGVNGRLLPDTASDAQWTQVLKGLLADGGERQRLAAKAVEVRELYAPAALQQRLMQALERVMQEAAAN